MPSLRRDLRSLLEKTVLKARELAEQGAHEALTTLGVNQTKAFENLKPEQKQLRNQLRARGRQVGDVLDTSGRQPLDHLVGVVAYEHWHRMLFARFLAENGLLLESDHQVPVSLADVVELARDAKLDVWDLAGRYAQRMLPAVFRADDPVLALPLARETRTQLEKLVGDLPRDVFLADDSLGWTYQFWQAQRKDEVNASGKKIGADELSPVTQLFTEDYMVEFLLHNTLGAWWAGKLGPIAAVSEEEARAKAGLSVRNGLGIEWAYLRFVRDEKSHLWSPAAGTFSGWPRAAKDVTFLDPCMGSGHFPVFAMPLLVRLRMEEEGLSCAEAVAAVLRDNIYGLELDERCTQIAAFNLALAAWKLAGHQPLPPLNLACSGLAPNATERDWVALAGSDGKLQRGMEQLFRLFQKAAVLGSLINPRVENGDLLTAAFHELQPLLEVALIQEEGDESAHEMTVTARGLAKAANILSGQFTIVATNVPYLGRGKQDDLLREYCDKAHPLAKADLATCFIERCMKFCVADGTAALVTPQNWWFLSSYSRLRSDFLLSSRINFIATMGEEAWQSFADRGPVATLLLAGRTIPNGEDAMAGIDALPKKTIPEKIFAIQSGPVRWLLQRAQYGNPDHRITIDQPASGPLLREFAASYAGIQTGDYNRFGRLFWEFPSKTADWEFQQSTVETTKPFGGREHMLRWEGGDALVGNDQARVQGLEAVGKTGIAISQMRNLAATIFTGDIFDNNCAAIVVNDPKHAAALWAYCESGELEKAVRRIDQKVSVTNATFGKVPFDLAHWESVAESKYPGGLPRPNSKDATQWLFNGNPVESAQSLHVAIARLLGYSWPRQTGCSFRGCSALGPDGLETHADADGIVCLKPVHGERGAADRLRVLLSAAFPKYDEQVLISSTGSSSQSLEAWLQDEFFDQHCLLFQQRPFIWHVWDGRSDGFHALLNYHKLAAPNGGGRKLLEALTYKGAGILRAKPGIKWDKDRGTEPMRPKADFPWLWKWDEDAIDFLGGNEFDGNRWNNCHYSTGAKTSLK